MIGRGIDDGVKGRSPSGLVESEVFIGTDEIDIKLPRDELFDKAEAGVSKRGNDVRAWCLGRGFANEEN